MCAFISLRRSIKLLAVSTNAALDFTGVGISYRRLSNKLHHIPNSLEGSKCRTLSLNLGNRAFRLSNVRREQQNYPRSGGAAVQGGQRIGKVPRFLSRLAHLGSAQTYPSLTTAGELSEARVPDAKSHASDLCCEDPAKGAEYLDRPMPQHGYNNRGSHELCTRARGSDLRYVPCGKRYFGADLS